MAHQSFRKNISRFFFLPQSERFSVIFAALMVLLAAISLCVDWIFRNDFYMFQRAGALLVLAGVELQYAKLTSTWKSELDKEIAAQPSVKERIDSGQGISMRKEAESSERVRGLTVRLHKLVTEKSAKDVWAVIFVIVGTIVWAYGDLPFKG